MLLATECYHKRTFIHEPPKIISHSKDVCMYLREAVVGQIANEDIAERRGQRRNDLPSMK